MSSAKNKAMNTKSSTFKKIMRSTKTGYTKKIERTLIQQLITTGLYVREKNSATEIDKE